jgi:hypothetical protein
MKRFLIVFVAEDQFLCETVEAGSIAQALNKFLNGPMGFDFVYSITTCA